ncbi:hypothetical protein ACFLT5_03340 [Chloroflexota bacterium]
MSDRATPAAFSFVADLATVPCASFRADHSLVWRYQEAVVRQETLNDNQKKRG